MPEAGFGELLRRLRLAADLTQEELSEASGVGVRTISNLERGINPSARKDTAARLAGALGMTDPARRDFLDRARRGPLRDAGPGGGMAAGSGASATRTLPRDITSFTGRDLELGQLAAAAARAAGVFGIHAIGGMAGVGKTAFAVHAAHLLAPRFPDGQIFLPLHGHTPGQRPVAPAEALRSLLLTVGVGAGKIPNGLEARTRVWRDHLASRSLLLLLDDAASSEQVRPLLPGTAGSLVIITSRRHLVALEDVQDISLDTLPPDEAARLLAALAARDDLEPGDPAVAELARLCGYLPLAIGMVGRQLHHRPAWTPAARAGYLATAQDRLSLLVAENLSVAAAFDLSYRDLPKAQRRLFRRLGLHPRNDIDSYAAAALDDITLAAAQLGLEGLYDNYLVTEPERGRYRLHDLIREHARALAASDPAPVSAAARDRLLAYYLHTARAADQHLARRAPAARPADSLEPPASSPDLPTGDDAVAWMTAERLNLDAIADYAAARGHDHVIALAAAMHGFLRTQGHWDQGLVLHRDALAAAQRAENHLAEAGALTDLGDMQYMSGEYAAADVSLTQALEISRDHGSALGEAEALKVLSFVKYETGDTEAATASLHRALECFRELGDRKEEASTLGYLAVVQQATGEYAEAIANQEQALALHQDLGNRFGEANALNFLGAAQQATGLFAAAAANQEAALALHRELGNPFGEANALNCLGAVQQARGDYAAAAASQQEALRLYRALGYRMGEGNVLNCIGSLLRETGDYDTGADLLKQALQIFRDLGIVQGEAEVLNTRGELLLAAGQLAGSRADHEAAREIADRITSPPEQARAVEGIGRCDLLAGRRAAAAAALRQALAIYQRIEPPRAERVAATLRDHDL